LHMPYREITYEKIKYVLSPYRICEILTSKESKKVHR
jgi:hypothetical protein